MILSSLITFSYLVASYYLARKIRQEFYLSLWLIFFFISILLSVELLGIFKVFSVIGLLSLGIFSLILIAIFEFKNFKKIGSFNLSKDVKGIPLLLILLFFAIIIVFFNEFAPVSEIDSVAYHLPIVSNLISTQSVWEVFHAGYVGPNTFFPANHEAIQAFFAVQTGNMNFGYIVTFLSFLLLFTALCDLARNKLSKLFCFLIALTCASIPCLFNQFVNLQIDLFMFCLFGSAIALILSSILNNEKLDLAKGFLVLGIMLGSKYNSIPQIAVLIPFLIIPFLYHRKIIKSIFWYPFLTLIPGIFWYIRNWIISGNPIYPFGIDLGFLHFEGHKVFMNDAVGTSLLNSITNNGIFSTILHVLGNGEFEIQLGKGSLLLFPAALLAYVLTLIVVLLKKGKKTKKEKWFAVIFVSLIYVFFAELFNYLNAPYTYSVWHQTIRYASSVFALLPVIFILSALYSRSVYFVLCYFSLGILAYNFFLRSFIFNQDYLKLIFDKVDLIPDIYFFALILSVILIGVLLELLARIKSKGNLFQFLLIFILSLTVSAYQLFISPNFIKNTRADDEFLSKKINIYSQILPHIEVLRENYSGNSQKIALAGLTPYWLFEKEKYTPIYVNIDGCLDCEYFDYRNAEKSVRSYPDSEKWKIALKTLDVKYLIVDYVSYADNEKMNEDEWAKNDKTMFTPLVHTDKVNLYRIN